MLSNIVICILTNPERGTERMPKSLGKTRKNNSPARGSSQARRELILEIEQKIN